MFGGVHLDKFVTYVKRPEVLVLAGGESQSRQSPVEAVVPSAWTWVR
jgi:hypothetical protein